MTTTTDTRDDLQQFDAMMQRIASGEQDLNSEFVRQALELDEGWDWGDVRLDIESGRTTFRDVERAVCESLQ